MTKILGPQGWRGFLMDMLFILLGTVLVGLPLAVGPRVYSVAAAIWDGELIALVPRRTPNCCFEGSSDGNCHEIELESFGTVPLCSDGRERMWFETEKGKGGVLLLVPDEGDMWLIDGTPEADCFEELPYSG